MQYPSLPLTLALFHFCFTHFLYELSMATTPSPFPHNHLFTPSRSSATQRRNPPLRHPLRATPTTHNALSLNYHFSPQKTLACSGRKLTCKVAEVSVAEELSASGDGGGKWLTVLPVEVPPKGERAVDYTRRRDYIAFVV